MALKPLPLVLQGLLVVVTAAPIAWALRSRLRGYDYAGIAAELLPLLYLWLVFGVGGILLLLRVEGVTLFREDIDPLAVPIFYGWLVIGGAALAFGFRVARRIFPTPRPLKDPERGITIAAGAFLLFDWFIRLRLIAQGVYFGWVAHLVPGEDRTGSVLYQLHDSVGFLTLALLSYLAFRDRRGRWLFRVLLALQLFLVVLEGSRAPVVLGGAVAMLVWALVRRKRPSGKVVAWGILGAVFFFGVFAPIFREARWQMRADALVLLSTPSRIPVAFAVEYLPRAATLDVIRGEGESQQSTVGRLGSYQAYAASILSARWEGETRIPFGQFVHSLSLVVPRALYPSKPVVDADAIVQEHFDFGVVGRDATGSPVADIYAYFGPGGVVVLLLLSGTIFGLLEKALRGRLCAVGAVLLIGLSPQFLPRGDAFGSYLAGFRTAIFSLIALLAILAAVRAMGSIAGLAVAGADPRPSVQHG